MRAPVAAGLWGFLVALPGPSVPAQAPRRQQLAPPAAVLEATFTFITSVRELSDGRVLVADPREGPVVVADFSRNRTAQVGRIGAGPGEYPAVTAFTALSGDTTAMVDVSRRRWTIFAGDRVVASLSAETSVVNRVTSALYSGSTSGTFLSTARLSAPTDSTAVILIPWNGSRQDTILKLAPPTAGRERSVSAFPKPYDRVLICPDGWIMVRRSEPYRVDWRDPSGRWVRGKAIEEPPVKVTPREKEEYHKRVANAGRKLPPGIALEWGEIIPPIDASVAPMCAPTGTILVKRTPTAANPDSEYDLFNRRGEREARLVMPASHRIVGFGRTVVYIAVADADGLERLQRHRWP